MKHKNILVFSLFLFVVSLFCAEENSIQIIHKDYPILCKSTTFVKKFNTSDLQEQVNLLCDFYISTCMYGDYFYQQQKAQEVILLIKRLMQTNQMPGANKDKLSRIGKQAWSYLKPDL